MHALLESLPRLFLRYGGRGKDKNVRIKNSRGAEGKKRGLRLFSASLCVAPVPQAAQLFAESGSAPVPMFSQEPLISPISSARISQPCMTTDRVQHNNIFFACLAQGVEYRPGDGHLSR